MPPSKSVQSLHNLFNTIQQDSEISSNRNLICSPFNIATCVSMLADGTAGTSREELINYFNFTGPDQKISLQNELLKTFNAVLLQKGPISDMVKCAQGIFTASSIEPSYIQKVTNDYRALAQQISPKTDTSATRKEINNFVSKATEGNITDLLKEGDISRDTIMVLVAALFFKGKFATPFPIENTSPQPFFVSADEKQQKQVPSMYHSVPNIKITENNNVVTAAIPYDGESLYLVLEMARPSSTKKQKFAPLPEKSDAAQILKCVSDDTEAQEREIFLPKFKARTSISTLKDLFSEKCGVNEIFRPKQNDFYPMVGGKPSDPSTVFISAIIHQAMVEVDEVGTVAAAATAAIMDDDDCSPSEVGPIMFNHPFYFHIVDKVNGSILFSGSIIDPSLSS